jgi:transmembrane protein 70
MNIFRYWNRHHKRINIICFNLSYKKITTQCISRRQFSEKYNTSLKDRPSQQGEHIYIGSLSSQLKKAKILSLTSSAFGISLLPLISDTVNSSSILAKIIVFGTTSFFIFVTPLLSIYLTKRYVNNIYYDKEKEILTLEQYNFFMMKKCEKIKLSDLYVPELPGLFSTIKNKKTNNAYFIELEQIKNITVLEKIYGFDKPFHIEKFKKNNAQK